MNTHKATTDPSPPVVQTLADEEELISRVGTPAAHLTPLQRERVPGSAQSMVQIAPNFDDPPLNTVRKEASYGQGPAQAPADPPA